jgi:hypothetical protein
MLASATFWRPGAGFGFAGFSSKSTMRNSWSSAITPYSVAMPMGTSTQPTEASAPRVTCSASSRA